jgi:hypothetical protein
LSGNLWRSVFLDERTTSSKIAFTEKTVETTKHKEKKEGKPSTCPRNR